MRDKDVFTGIALTLLALGAFADGLPALPKTSVEALRLERGNSMPRTALYSEPIDLSNSKPGDLLRQEVVTGYTLPVKKAVRIVYHSLDATQGPTAASAVILIPQGATPAGGWPVIAWAHGTSGVAPQCAPSLMKDVWYRGKGLLDMLKGGFAVVATDYSGLGVGDTHLWVTKKAQAHDVIYSIPAARAAVPDLGRRWVVDGHSEGGVAAWGVAELESATKDENYQGAISVSGTADVMDFMQHINNEPEGFHYLEYLASTVHQLYPEFQPDEILTAPLMRVYGSAIHNGCWYYGYSLLEGVPKGKALVNGWEKNPWIQKYSAGDAEGTRSLSKPILVIAGEADRTVPIESARNIGMRACKLGSRILLKTYPGMDHVPTMTASIGTQLAWIRDRLAGVPAPSNCGS